MRKTSTLTLTLACLASAATAGPNADARLVLHAIPHAAANTCQTPAQTGYDDCTAETVTQVDAGAEVDIYVFLQGYGGASGMQVSFVWDPGWILIEWVGLCVSGQIDAEVPSASGDNYSNQFVCRSSGTLLPLGRLHMIAGPIGTALTVGDHGSGLTGVADCEGIELDAFGPGERGSVVVGAPGANPCNPTAIVPSTWGRIKATLGGPRRRAPHPGMKKALLDGNAPFKPTTAR